MSFRHAFKHNLGSVSGGLTPAQKAALLFDDGMGGIRKGGLFDRLDLTSMFVERDGTGGNPAVSGSFGLWLDKKHMGGLLAAQYMTNEGISDPLLVPGIHLIAPADNARLVIEADGPDADGVNDCFDFVSNPLTGATEAMIFARGKLDANPTSNLADGPLYGDFGSSVQETLHPYFGDSNIYDNFGSNLRPAFGSVSFVGTDWFTLESHVAGTTHNVYVDEALLGTQSSMVVGWGSAPKLFCTKNAKFFKGRAKSFLLIDTTLTGDDLATARSFVNQ